ncbi:MAG: glucose-1-phosphate adenylyltransferase [Candidatus Eisenbacteria bacterium]|uniref:Glucose-1-phosphate adenylyltransferase n=1 Tax=Eiseniibacteriota bacterium TaxID=2212470 RepID=A0A938BQC7_UNCEI|nr:glucose-1-phosphate adenylyltransferase [Candidatus Eisenbacteria bacterium]
MLSRITFPQTTGMVLAGGRVGELSVLTLERPKAALPFAGHFRIVDFALSNMARAGITNVGILSQYRPSSLIDHIGVGESWDFVGLERGAKILPPYHAAEATDWYRGNADAVLQNLSYLEGRDTQIALIVSGDHIYAMDYRRLILEHLERGAELTMAFKRIPEPDRRYGYGVLDASGRVVEYAEKPASPPGDLVSLTIYVFQMEPLAEVLLALREHDSIEFGRDVIPAMLARGRVYGHIHDGYWAYTRTVDSYYDAHRDLLDGKIDIDAWQVRTNNVDNGLVRQVPPIFRAWTEASDCLISEGCIVEGAVRGSVLGPGVRIGRGAVVEASILFGDAVVEPGARVRAAIVDKRALIGAQAAVGIDAPAEGGARGAVVSAKGIALVGKAARLQPGSRLPRGGIVAPGEER